MNVIKRTVILVCAVLLFASAGFANTSIIPKPVEVKAGRGFFELNAQTTVICGSDHLSVLKTAKFLQSILQPATGLSLAINPPAGKSGAGAITLKLIAQDDTLNAEGYQLTVTKKAVTIASPTAAGLFYGVQSLRQLLPAEIYGHKKAAIEWKISCVEIKDYPRFKWRGMHLDVGRYFMSKEFVKKFIDLIAQHKFNRFHMHLTDDQGWRIEIKKYPKLTEIGAWRKETVIGHVRKKPMKFDGEKHGGFYSQDDVRELVAYAAERHITIVPEIEMPGHSQAAIAAYPQLGNIDKKLDVRTYWGVCNNICNADDSTISFFQDVLTEVMALFPSEFIHIGGDEAPKAQWEKSPKAQRRIKELGLKNEHELQSWFIKQMDNFLTSKGRRLIGWDEILEGGLAPGAAVMSWRGEKGGIAAANAGHDAVMAPNSHTYLDYYQSKSKGEPLAIGGFLPLQKVYSYDPVPKALNKDKVHHILGAQAQIWTEYIETPDHAEYMAFPRTCAMAEVVWSKKESKDYNEFITRLNVHLKRLDLQNVNYRKLD